MSECKRFDSEISLFLKNRNVALFGFADLSPIPEKNRYNYPRSISFANPISKEILRQIKLGPTTDYFTEFNRINMQLLTTAKELQEYIISLGFDALALEGAARKYDTETLLTTLPHKTSATLAGLGWIGKDNLLTTEKFGSGIRFSTVLTDIPLTSGTPITESHCGECKTCFEKCPAHAIIGMNWRIGMKREDIYDAFACQAMAKKLSTAIGADHTICGVCIANCPKTERFVNGI